MYFNINTDRVVAFTNTLEQLHKSALPSAIRNTLNDAAFDVKTVSMPAMAGDTFENRSPNFFKANSKFEKASGFDVSTMKSTVGFVEGGLKGGNNFSVKDLEQQESGGTIEKKSFIPLDTARVGKSPTKLVKPNARLKSINNIINARRQKGKTKAERFVQATLVAGAGGYVLGSAKNGESILWRVDSLSSNIKTKKFEPKLTPLYDWAKGRNVRVKPTHFMKSASIQSANKMEWFYEKQANRQIAKFLHK